MVRMRMRCQSLVFFAAVLLVASVASPSRAAIASTATSSCTSGTSSINESPAALDAEAFIANGRAVADRNDPPPPRAAPSLQTGKEDDRNRRNKRKTKRQKPKRTLRYLPHFYRCDPRDGGGICPMGSTCCRAVDDRATTSRCIPTVEKGASCCSDDARGNGPGVSFCFAGYDCARATTSGGSSDDDINFSSATAPMCARNASKTQSELYSEWFGDAMPQYATCHAPTGSIESVYGLPVPMPSDRPKDATADDPTTTADGGSSGNSSNSGSHRLAYFSTHGDLLHIALPDVSQLQAAVVVVHGYRNQFSASHQYCSTVVAARLQDYYPLESVLVVAPWFQVSDEPKITFSSTDDEGSALRWDMNDRLHGWPYGKAASEPPSAANFNVTSFDALDAVVTVLADRRRFPHLDLIAVAGSCNGAELVQRWALFSDVPAWDGDLRRRRRRREEEKVEEESKSHDHNRGVDRRRRDDDAPRIRPVVLMPSELTYLAKDWYQRRHRIHDKSLPDRCRNCNDYPFGLEFPTTQHPVPYVEAAMARVGGSTETLARRYASRDVIYVASSLDVERKKLGRFGLPSVAQGRTNVEVYENFRVHLESIFPNEDVHTFLEVDGVGHDYALVLQQEVGLLAVFGGDDGMCPNLVPWAA